MCSRLCDGAGPQGWTEPHSQRRARQRSLHLPVTSLQAVPRLQAGLLKPRLRHLTLPAPPSRRHRPSASARQAQTNLQVGRLAVTGQPQMLSIWTSAGPDIPAGQPQQQRRDCSRCPAPAGGKQCTRCRADDTPLWRTGPAGPKTLCNACGVKHNRACAGKAGGRSVRPPIGSAAQHTAAQVCLCPGPRLLPYSGSAAPAECAGACFPGCQHPACTSVTPAGWANTAVLRCARTRTHAPGQPCRHCLC